MGVQFESEDTQRRSRMLAERWGVTEEYAIGNLLQRELEREGLLPPEDEGVRRARLMAEHHRRRVAQLPPDEQEAHRRRVDEFKAMIRGIQERVAALPLLDSRLSEEIMRDMYDEDGLPK